GVPYTEDQIENAVPDLRGQAMPDSDAAYDFEERWPDAKVRDFDGNPREVTEMDALVAYLQVLGTMVDFSIYDDAANAR
ncbi:MAG: cbb3-type cytochrome c oxidase subunit II, partial [Pseudomonadota bacterium]